MSTESKTLKQKAAEHAKKAFELLREAQANGAPNLATTIRHLVSATAGMDRSVEQSMKQELIGSRSAVITEEGGGRFGKKAPVYPPAPSPAELESVITEAEPEQSKFRAPEYKVGEEPKNTTAPDAVEEGDGAEEEIEVIASSTDDITVEDVAKATKEELAGAYTMDELKEINTRLGIGAKGSSSKPAFAARMIKAAQSND